MKSLPRAILFDMDDTILAAFGQAQDQWRRVIAAFIEQLAPHPPDEVVAAIQAYSRRLWSDATRHKDWRPRIGAARRHIVARAFAGLAGAAGRPVPSSEVCEAMADRFNEIHDAELRMFPGAHETLDRLKQLGVRLALVTNGAAEPHRGGSASMRSGTTAIQPGSRPAVRSGPIGSSGLCPSCCGNRRSAHCTRRSPMSARQPSIGSPLSELFARSSQAATTAANSAFEGGLPAVVCHSLRSEEAWASVAPFTIMQATRPSRKTATHPRTRPPDLPSARLRGLRSAPLPGFWQVSLFAVTRPR